MYDSLTDKSGNVVSGVGAVNKYLSQYGVTDADGLSLSWSDTDEYGSIIFLPDRLFDWLTNLRLLRDIPLSYLVPDAALLPPESIRFFHVDPTWTDRVIDGVFAAANTGTLDLVFCYRMLQGSRDGIDSTLTALAKTQVAATNWDASAQPMTGMLIRSELVRRWPDMIIRAYDDDDVPDPLDAPLPPTVAVLRAEPISKDVYIALFAGEPKMIQIREPNVGTRYGVESTNPNGGPPYKVDARPVNGDTAENPPQLAITFRSPQSLRIIDLSALASASASAANIVKDLPRQVALNLEQLPYVQEFKQKHPERRGSRKLGDVNNEMTFRRGRKVKLDKLAARDADLNDLGS